MTTQKPALGWIGTGVMGLSMAGHLLKAGYPLTIYNRTKAKAQALLDAGATWADSPKAVGAASNIVFSIVGFPADVEEVLLSPTGALAGLAPGGILCDMTTSSPALAVRIAEKAAAKGCFGVDAPVTGGDVGAKAGSLSILVGGEAAAFSRLQPCLACMGQNVVHFGPAGCGQKAKLANQVAIAGVMFSTCESLLFAQEAGLNVRTWLQTVIPGGAGSIAMTTLGPRIVDGNFAPGFFVEHFLKDLALCLDECRRMGLVLPGLSAAEGAYRALVAQGYGKQGTQVLVKGLASLTAKTWNIQK
ncbi:MAG: NAD(P)-dependent oxidoreductase [Desulfovibrionaceae bacterium]